MPGETISFDIQRLREAVIEAVWIQWRTLGTLIESARFARTLVDPEALLLISLTLRHHEKRLWDVLASWAKNGSGLFSVQRVKNLRGGYPDSTQDRLAEFAHRAGEDGGDFRWQRLAGSSTGPAARNQDLWRAYPRAWHPSALILRMRLGFGIGVMPDLLSFLFALGGQWADARRIAQATAYSVYSIRRVADDMASAQLIESTQQKPVQYRVSLTAWRPLLSLDRELGGWLFWHQIYSFAAKLIVAGEDAEWEGLSPYLLSTTLRDLVEAHQDAFLLNHIDFPDPSEHPGEAFLPAFAQALDNLTTWFRGEA